MFRAATPSDEVREVLRRIAAEGVKYEDVELVATDRDTYGLALECLAAPLGVPLTSLHGVPFPRTRLGRALARWLAWLEEGLPADMLREAIEAGELVVTDAGADPMAPARLLRELAIGWGRARWDEARAALGTAAFVSRARQGDDEPDDDFRPASTPAAPRPRRSPSLLGHAAGRAAARCPNAAATRRSPSSIADLADVDARYLDARAARGPRRAERVRAPGTRLEGPRGTRRTSRCRSAPPSPRCAT